MRCKLLSHAKALGPMSRYLHLCPNMHIVMKMGDLMKFFQTEWLFMDLTILVNFSQIHQREIRLADLMILTNFLQFSLLPAGGGAASATLALPPIIIHSQIHWGCQYMLACNNHWLEMIVMSITWLLRHDFQKDQSTTSWYFWIDFNMKGTWVPLIVNGESVPNMQELQLSYLLKWEICSYFGCNWIFAIFLSALFTS